MNVCETSEFLQTLFCGSPSVSLWKAPLSFAIICFITYFVASTISSYWHSVSWRVLSYLGMVLFRWAAKGVPGVRQHSDILMEAIHNYRSSVQHLVLKIRAQEKAAEAVSSPQ